MHIIIWVWQQKNNQDLKQAENSYKKVLELNPKHVDALNNLGTLYHEQKFYNRSLDSFNAAIAQNPTDLEANFNKASVLRDTGNLDMAISAYEKLLKFNPDFPRALTEMGEIFKSQGEDRKAMER